MKYVTNFLFIAICYVITLYFAEKTKDAKLICIILCFYFSNLILLNLAYWICETIKENKK